MLDKRNPDLYEYLKTSRLPQYALNDSGHGIEHIEYVVKRCFRFLEQFENINYNILYTAAVYHDIAHHIDKKNHEKLSADIFYKDEAIKKFFNENEITIIKEAIEDHRASLQSEPRNVYGKILSSADRSTDIDDFLKRTHAYTLKHQPKSTYNEMIERAYIHTKEKYGTQGYAKHYVIDDEYIKFRAEIQNLIENKGEFILKYNEVNGL